MNKVPAYIVEWLSSQTETGMGYQLIQVKDKNRTHIVSASGGFGDDLEIFPDSEIDWESVSSIGLYQRHLQGTVWVTETEPSIYMNLIFPQE